MADSGAIDPAIFEHLQAKIDEDTQVRDELRTIVQELERQGRTSIAILQRAHSTPTSRLQDVLTSAEKSIKVQKDTVAKLASVASKYPYYKYNATWSRELQNLVFAIVLCGWLGGLGKQQGTLMTIEEVGGLLEVPVNLKTSDDFHLTIEEYLQALISLVEELARLAVNSVTLSNYTLPLQISRFVKDLHSGFQMLNLKNDSLRRRSDGIKYQIKKCEDVVYDLSLRGLVGKEGEEQGV